MAKIRHCGTKCLNCGEQLTIETNYCPVCGQLNDNPKVSFGQLIFDFLSNYFSLDSKFSRSFVPFLFQPGYLTNRFIEGKRVSFVNPIRHYFIISLVFFFTVSAYVKNMTDSVTFNNNTGISNNVLAAADSTLSEDEKKSIAEIKDAHIPFLEISNLSENDWNLYQSMKSSNQYKPKQILDSLKVEERSFWERLIIKQYIKLDQSNAESISGYIVQNASMMMFFLLPLYALILKAIYRKRKEIYYIEHLIHSLHIHAFVFLAYTIYVLFQWLWDVDLGGAVFWIITLYIFFSLRNVYKQSYIKTAIKLFLIGSLYMMLFGIVLLAEIVISLLVF